MGWREENILKIAVISPINVRKTVYLVYKLELAVQLYELIHSFICVYLSSFIQDESNVIGEEEDKENDPSAANQISNTQGAGDASQASKKPLTMNFEEYKRLSNTLVLYIRQQEEEAELRSGKF